jgi:hypothetical protein
MLQIVLLLLAAYVLWCGIRGLRGKPDPLTSSNSTTLPVAIACIVLAVAIAGFALIGLPMM